jgi:type II restriction enzyme
MQMLKASDIVNMIDQLGTHKIYDYYRKKTKIRITEVVKPEGPIKFMRWDSQKSESNATTGGISTNQLGIIASVFSRRPNYPINFDRLFSGGGNSRSALETLLAHTSRFFICYPERTNIYTGKIEKELKHIMWCPSDAHPLGEISKKDYKQVISEVELDVDFGNIGITQGMLSDEFDSIETKKVHTQMQVALVKIGQALDFHTWVAKNDRAIKVENIRLGELQGVIPSLEDVGILYNHQSKQAASLIDCIWFSTDFKYIPAVIEIEHSTGVTSGLTRMMKFKEAIPSIVTNYTIVAPNDIRNKVVSEANNAVFRKLMTRYMAYSTVRELYGLIQRYKLSNVVQRTFIEPFMENVVED